MLQEDFETAAREIRHDLRRSFVTRTRKLGVPESVVMQRLGHCTGAMFDLRAKVP